MKRWLRRILDWFGFTAMFTPGGYKWSMMSPERQTDWLARHRRFGRTFFVAFWLAMLVYGSHIRDVSRREANEYRRSCVISVLMHTSAGERWLNATIALPTPDFLAQAEVLLGPELLKNLPTIVENRPIYPRSVAFMYRSEVIRGLREEKRTPEQQAEFNRRVDKAFGPQLDPEFKSLVDMVFGPQSADRDQSDAEPVSVPPDFKVEVPDPR